ncbi:MAG: hypothetical protein CBE10_00555 [bacterium TMED250]|nr:MAG: hypothetical protein CBE10_00555 [bacterium TMED250]|tara:strand:+ start:14064 stop:14489 length:426 start_codon:yes stop_codon:yes gene_type:complete
MCRNYFTYFLLLFSLIAGQNRNQDSLKLKSPSVAALRAFTFPGGGQFYNNQPLKGSLLTSAGIASVYLYYDHSNKYNNSSSLSSVDKKNYLFKRNRYGWWIIIVYIYGLLDAIVEAHLHPFSSVMNEDLEKNKTESKNTNE